MAVAKRMAKKKKFRQKVLFFIKNIKINFSLKYNKARELKNSASTFYP
jgi:hypothetical protein